MVKIMVDVPKQMIEVAQREETRERPYDLCLTCPFISETCDGPNCLAMSNDRWLEWANARAQQMDLSRTDIAESSGVPLSTVNSIMSGRTRDVRHSTMREITKVLIGGCWGQYPCHFAAMMLTSSPLEEDVSTDIGELRAQLAHAEEIRRADVAAAKEEDQRKVDYLKTTVDELKHSNRTYRITTIAMGLIMAAVVLIDVCLRNFGWIRW